MAETAACLKTIGRAQLALGRDEDGIATLERALALALGANANRLASPVFANLGAGCVDAFRLAPAEARLARASTSASSATSMLQGVYQTAAADAWRALGCRFECARALSQGDEAAQREALALFEALGARPMVERVRHRLRAAGVRGLPRGPRRSTREHPGGPTSKEVAVLELLAAGLCNKEIALRLHRSARTVDHHLVAIFGKLGVATRAEAVSEAYRLGVIGAMPGSA